MSELVDMLFLLFADFNVGRGSSSFAHLRYFLGLFSNFNSDFAQPFLKFILIVIIMSHYDLGC